MLTPCMPTRFDFQPLGSREVVAAFNGGKVTSDAGGLLLHEVEAKFGFITQCARCFTAYRDPDCTTHTLEELLKQRIFGLCLGYADLNDHDQLRYDPLLAVLVGKKEPLGEKRPGRDTGKALAGKSTLNRLELTPVRANADSRYKKIVAHLDTMQHYLVQMFAQQYVAPPTRIVLDVDATDFVLHGHQLGRFFHGYDDEYCYLPLYSFCGDVPLLALLRPANLDEPVGLLKHLKRIVAYLRQVWPNVQILVRGDSGFCREHLMRWCEASGVDFLFGLPKNARLLRILGGERHQAKMQFDATPEASRVFKDFTSKTTKTWSRERRGVGKAQHLAKGENPRFVVTSLSPEAFAAQILYEQEYCGRGNMEKRSKEKKRFLFADRVRCQTRRANQVRLCLSTVAYLVLRALRDFGLRDTELSHAPCDTLRVKLLKIGATIRVRVRRVVLALSEAFPFQTLFQRAWEKLRNLGSSFTPLTPVSAHPPPDPAPCPN